MEGNPVPRIVSAERLDEALVVTFGDGKCALYSAPLLQSLITQAEDLSDLANPDED
jgi:hypothetical protein